MENSLTVNEIKALNLHCYFDVDYAYVEEFDTEDGQHWMGRLYPKDWTQEIFDEAVTCGFVDECLRAAGEKSGISALQPEGNKTDS